MNEEPRNREIYRGTLTQKKEVWMTWAEGYIAKDIAGRFRPSPAISTIYLWFKEFKNLSPQSLLAIYQEDGPPDLIIEKWKSFHVNYPEMIKEIDELKQQRQTKDISQASPKENENTIIAPPICFEKNEMGLCRNAGLRSDCGPCFYLRLGRTQENIDWLVEQSLSLQSKVEKAKEDFLERLKERRVERE